MTTVLSCNNVSYGAGNKKLLASNISFDLNQSEVMIIHGPNGVGKTTFLKTILGENRHFTGQLELSINPSEVSYLPQLQNPSFHLPLTLNDVLEISHSDNDLSYSDINLLEQRHLDLLWKTASGGERRGPF